MVEEAVAKKAEEAATKAAEAATKAEEALKKAEAEGAQHAADAAQLREEVRRLEAATKEGGAAATMAEAAAKEQAERIKALESQVHGKEQDLSVQQDLISEMEKEVKAKKTEIKTLKEEAKKEREARLEGSKEGGAELDEAKGVIKSLEDEVETLKEQVEGREEDLQMAKEMAKQQSERVKAVEAELEAAKKATDEATKAADDAKKAVEEAKMEVEALQEQVEGKGDDLAMAEEMVKAQKEQLEQARAELERVRGDREEESTGKAAGAKKELEAAQTEAATLRAKVQQLEAAVQAAAEQGQKNGGLEELQAEKEAAEATAEEMVEKMAQMEEELVQAREELELTKLDLEILQEEKDTFGFGGGGGEEGGGEEEGDVGKLQGEVRQLKGALQQLHTVGVEQRKKIAELEAVLADTSAKADEAEQLGEQVRQLETEKQELMEIVDSNESASDMVQELSVRNAKLEEDNAAHLDKITDLEELKMIADEMEETYQENEKLLNAELASAEAKLSQQMLVVTQLQKKVTDAEKVASHRKDLIAGLEQEIDRLSDQKRSGEQVASERGARSTTLLTQNISLQAMLRDAQAKAGALLLFRLKSKASELKQRLMQSFVPKNWVADDAKGMEALATLLKLQSGALHAVRGLEKLLRKAEDEREGEEEEEGGDAEEGGEAAKAKARRDRKVLTCEDALKLVKSLGDKCQQALHTVCSASVEPKQAGKPDVDAAALLRAGKGLPDLNRAWATVEELVAAAGQTGPSALDNVGSAARGLGEAEGSVQRFCDLVRVGAEGAVGRGGPEWALEMAQWFQSEAEEVPEGFGLPPCAGKRAEAACERIEATQAMEAKLQAAQKDLVERAVVLREREQEIEALHLKIQMMEAEGKGGSKGGDKKLAAHLETLQAEYDRYKKDSEEAMSKYMEEEEASSAEIQKLRQQLAAGGGAGAGAKGGAKGGVGGGGGFGDMMDSTAAQSLVAGLRSAASVSKAREARGRFMQDLPSLVAQAADLQPLSGVGSEADNVRACRRQANDIKSRLTTMLTHPSMVSLADTAGSALVQHQCHRVGYGRLKLDVDVLSAQIAATAPRV